MDVVVAVAAVATACKRSKVYTSYDCTYLLLLLLEAVTLNDLVPVGDESSNRCDTKTIVFWHSLRHFRENTLSQHIGLISAHLNSKCVVLIIHFACILQHESAWEG